MNYPLSVLAPLFAWGTMVGFVAWGSFARISGPVGDFLLERHSETSVSSAVARVIVMLFLMSATMLVLAIPPAIVTQRLEPSVSHAVAWKTLYGVSFVGSLIGATLLGVLRRAQR